jgi:hypothetical protein
MSKPTDLNRRGFLAGLAGLLATLGLVKPAKAVKAALPGPASKTKTRHSGVFRTSITVKFPPMDQWRCYIGGSEVSPETYARFVSTHQ